MEQELKKLGLNKCLSKKTIDKLNNIDEELKNNKDLILNDSFNLIEVEEKPSSSSSLVPQQKQKFKSNARRMSSIGIMTTGKSNDEFANIKKIRKFSLDQHQSVTSGKSNLIKSYRRLSMANDTLLKPFNNETNKTLIPQQQQQQQPARISPSSLFAPSSSVKTDSSSDQNTNLYTAAGSINSTSRNRSSISSYSSVNLPKLSRLSLSRSISSAINNTNTNTNNNNTNKSNKEVESTKRRVSFCQIDLNQLDNPKLYRYTNTAAYDRFKFNPHYYLPDGTLKRKFSLPKLSDTLEAVKNCNYLRRKSIDNIADQLEVINIFKNSHNNNNNNNSNSTAPTTPTRDLNFNNNTSIYVSQLD
jgi:hypothetical protein